jgi:protein-tyrosine phosphatase
MNKVLFLDGANFFRSRFAEAFFEHAAQREQLLWQADSRAWDPDPSIYFGPFSPHVIHTLSMLGIEYNSDVRFPLRVQEQDFRKADQIICLDSPEMVQHLPEFLMYNDKIEFWDIPHPISERCDYLAVQIVVRIRQLVEELKISENQPITLERA